MGYKWRTRLLFLLTLGLAAMLRFYDLPSAPPGLYPDEAVKGNQALEAWRSGDFRVFYSENFGREGLFINAEAVAMAALGRHIWVLRGVSALFGTLTVIGIYVLALAMFRRQSVALLAMFLIATSFWHIVFSRIGFRAIGSPMFLVWGLALLLWGLDSASRKAEGLWQGPPLSGGWRLAAPALLGGLVYGLGFHTYIAYRSSPLLILAILLLYWLAARRHGWQQAYRSQAAAFILGVALTTLPLAMHFLQKPHDLVNRISSVSVLNSPTAGKDLLRNAAKTALMLIHTGDDNWRHNISGKPQLFWPVGLLFLLGVGLAIRRIGRDSGRWRRERMANRAAAQSPVADQPPEASAATAQGPADEYREASGLAILLIWLFAAAIPAVMSNNGIPHALRSIVMIPAVCILAAWTISWVWQRAILPALRPLKSRRVLARAIAVSFLVLTAIDAYHSYFLTWAKEPRVAEAFKQEFVDIARQLDAMPDSVPKYVVVEAGGIDVSGLPMPAQTVMFITDTFSPKDRQRRNIHYVLPSQRDSIPPGSVVVVLRRQRMD